MTDIPGFVISGAPRSKKTSQQIVTIPAKGSRRCRACGQCAGPEKCDECGQLIAKGFKKIIPSDAYEAWHKEAMVQLMIVKAKLRQRGVEVPITDLINVRALFYQDVDRADAVGLYEGLGDTLQDAGIIENDKQIAHWDGSRRLKDKARPRIEVWLTVISTAPAQGSLLGEVTELKS